MPMSMGARKTDDWAETEPAPAEPTAGHWDEAIDAPAPGSARRTAAALLLALLALGWIGLVGWTAAGAGAALLPVVRDMALACVPLALLAILFVVLRGGNALRFGGNAAALDTQVRALDDGLRALGTRLAADRAALADHARLIAEAGDMASARLGETSATMQSDAALLDRSGRTLEYAAAAARTDLAVLLEGMPQLEANARAIAVTMRDTGDGADQRVRALGHAMAALAQRGVEVDEHAGGAADRLAAHVSRLEGAGEAAGQRLEGAASQMTDAVDAALRHAAQAMERSRTLIDEQAAAMRALIEQARAAIDRTGAETAAAAAARLDQMAGQVDAIGATLARQDVAARDLIGGLNAGLRAIEGRFADLGTIGAAEGARLAATVQSVAGYAEQVREGLVVGGDAADALIARATALGERLEGPARQLHEALPEALARLDHQARRSVAAMADAVPQMQRLDQDGAAVAARLEAIAASLATQAEAGAEAAAAIERRIAAATDAARALDAAIGEADERARQVADGSASALIDAMVRVRMTAGVAADRAREAIGAVIPDSVATLAAAGEAALSAGVTRAVEGQVSRLHAMSDAVSGSAQRAAERLASQMLQLAETTATVEQRLDAAQEQAEAAKLDSFPRRAAHLIDALNSASIDIAKILSTEVTDTVWAAYLKGDRGVFTRRAVRLLEAGEARAITRHYGEDPEFRDQVNRYVHDFEALLRPVVAGRDGAPLAVTLLGSDMGKLYVALANAISRLRS